ncbi:glycosyltransferase, partial [Candidatus Fermentibacterales bacterium]|nr:glycosyltransferase [Candidatus Fermentibacterales bacterium]
WGELPGPPPRYELARVRGPGKLWPLRLAMRLRSLDLSGYDSIILNDIGACFVFGSFFGGSIHVRRAIVFLHGGEPVEVFLAPHGYLRLTRFARRYARLLSGSKAVVAVSDYMKDYFLRHSPSGLDAAKISVIYSGIDQELFRPVESGLRGELGIEEGASLLLSTGRITEEKGFPGMLSVFEELVAGDAGYAWVVVGTGPYACELRSRADRSAVLKDRIILRGYVERPELPAYYSSADLFWLLSAREGESFGLVYAEAQSCGCPALGLAMHGVNEAIENGVTGYLVSDERECLALLRQHAYSGLDRRDIASRASRWGTESSLERLEGLL